MKGNLNKFQEEEIKKQVENWNNEKEIDEARLQYYSNKFGSIIASTIKGNVLS